MKVKNIKNPQEFMEVIDKCSGKVELLTTEGDRLNLKSKLCQYISLTSIFTSASKIEELEIVAYEPEDTQRILEYIMKG